MPTEPFKQILDRDLAKALGSEIIHVASAMLKELVNHATNAFVRCDRCANGGIDEDLAPFTLYYHIIQQTDAIEVLISECCSTSIIPLLRSSFEALLSLEYIFENDEELVQRSLSWLLKNIHERLDCYDRLDFSTPKGADFKRNLDHDILTMPTPNINDVRTGKSTLERMFQKPHLEPIEAEFKKFDRKPYWYQLFGGPQNFRELAIHLKRGAEYDILYRNWSKFSHAQDIIPLANKNGKMKMMRDPNEIKIVTNFSFNFMLHSTILMIQKFRQGEKIHIWYEREIGPLLQKFCKLPEKMVNYE